MTARSVGTRGRLTRTVQARRFCDREPRPMTVSALSAATPQCWRSARPRAHRQRDSKRPPPTNHGGQTPSGRVWHPKCACRSTTSEQTRLARMLSQSHDARGQVAERAHHFAGVRARLLAGSPAAGKTRSIGEGGTVRVARVQFVRTDRGSHSLAKAATLVPCVSQTTRLFTCAWRRC
ncbi:MAG: hypothetical protein ACI9S9_000303 [Planctomycetota bacterium]|jgi:hypothetical protein